MEVVLLLTQKLFRLVLQVQIISEMSLVQILRLQMMEQARRNQSSALGDALGASQGLFGQDAARFGLNQGAQQQAFRQGQDIYNTNADMFFRNLAAQNLQEDRDWRYQMAPYEAAMRLFQGQGNPHVGTF